MEPSITELSMPIESQAGSSVYMSNASQTEIQVEVFFFLILFFNIFFFIKKIIKQNILVY